MSLTEAVEARAPKMSLTNIVSGEEVEAQFNPNNLEEVLRVNWEELDTQGQSHLPLHYKNTANFEVPLELFFRALSTGELALIHRARRHIHSWAYPRLVSEDIVGGGPPGLLFLWPGMLSLRCVLRDARIRHEQFNSRGRSVQFRANITLAEIRDVRLHFDEVASDQVGRFGSGSSIEG